MRLYLAVLVLFSMPTFALAQGSTTPLRAGRLSKEETAALQPGWVATVYAKEVDATPLDARRLRVAALHVPAGTPATPWIAAGPFVARLQGWLKVPLKGEHTLRLEVRGAATLTVNDELLLTVNSQQAIASKTAAVVLAKGYNRVDLLLTSTPAGEATARISWSGDGFVEEPLPPEALFSRRDDEALVSGSALREGRDLFASRRCTQCHALAELPASAVLAMPELQGSGPSLAGVGSRLQEAWLREWILGPQQVRPSATMPHLLTGDEQQQQQTAADLAAYLASLKVQSNVAGKVAEATEEIVNEGRVLFENLGCIACHHTKPAAEADTHGRLSLSNVKAKFAPGALRAFLLKPQQHYAWTRMPSFALSDDEADRLASYLASIESEKADEEDTLRGSPARGQALFASLQCVQCHAIDAQQSPVRKSVVVLTREVNLRGCLASERVVDTTAPDFRFNEQQRNALLALLRSDQQSLTRETPAEFSLRQVQQLRCHACHRRDGNSSILSQVLQDESEQGLSPEILPTLTWTGEKLKPAWSERLLAGEAAQRARPWLRARMPAFPARAKLLSAGLSHEHGFAVDEHVQPEHDKALAIQGEQLAGENGGLACIKCHAVGSQPALAPFEAPGINLVDAAARLRHSYYSRWMFDPPRVDVSTKMPKFSVDGRTTSARDVLAGDAAKQYEALWHYIQSLPADSGKK